MTATHPDIAEGKGPYAHGFTITRDGKLYITAVWLSLEHGWAVKVRATFPVADRHDPELLAAMSWLFAAKTIAEHDDH
jgi:hypothetical protein